jgi:hypothetical protein
MVTQIVIHLLPQEIDWFEWQIKQLKQGSYYLEKDDKVIIDVTLNLNLVEWNKSQLPKQFFIDKFLQIKKLCDWCETQFTIDEENKCLGCVDKRREAIRSTVADNILYLDSDLIFKPELLSYIIYASKIIKEPYYIISPQTTRMWDNSWDILTNQKYLNTPPNLETYYNIDPFKIISDFTKDINIVPINQFKFGGGWFNLLSTKLLKLTDMPNSFGPYGVDDTYVMVCCNLIKQKKYQIQQYILEGTIIIENFKYRWNPYKDYLYLTNKQDEFRQQAELNFENEINFFKNKLL